MLEGQDKMLEGQDKMLEKQDKMLEGQDKMLEGQDKMLEGQDQTHAAIQTMDRHLGEKFDWLGDRYGEFGMKMSRLEEDIHVIKKASVELVKHITGKADSKTV